MTAAETVSVTVAKACKVSGCVKKARARGHCSMHAARIDRHGSPDVTLVPMYGSTPEEKFAHYTPDRPNGECWLWQGKRQVGGGYGVIDRPGPGGRIYAHRLSYEMHCGPIPDGHLIRHACDNPPCVNPEHLSTGTSADNVRDAVDRDRVQRGEASAQARLSDAAVADLRRLHSAGVSAAQLAERFEVAPSYVRGVVAYRLRRPKGMPARITHPQGSSRCRNGHERTAENTYMNRGRRHCRACRAAADKRAQARAR